MWLVCLPKMSQNIDKKSCNETIISLLFQISNDFESDFYEFKKLNQCTESIFEESFSDIEIKHNQNILNSNASNELLSSASCNRINLNRFKNKARYFKFYDDFIDKLSPLPYQADSLASGSLESWSDEENEQLNSNNLNKTSTALNSKCSSVENLNHACHLTMMENERNSLKLNSELIDRIKEINNKVKNKTEPIETSTRNLNRTISISDESDENDEKKFYDKPIIEPLPFVEITLSEKTKHKNSSNLITKKTNKSMSNGNKNKVNSKLAQVPQDSMIKPKLLVDTSQRLTNSSALKARFISKPKSQTTYQSKPFKIVDKTNKQLNLKNVENKLIENSKSTLTTIYSHKTSPITSSTSNLHPSKPINNHLITHENEKILVAEAFQKSTEIKEKLKPSRIPTFNSKRGSYPNIFNKLVNNV